jgi:galactokinase
MNGEGNIGKVSVSAPGRICLCGEHQDYFGLPVVPAAIDLRITITGERRGDNLFNIQLPDIGAGDEFAIDREAPYILERDYLRSAFNVLRRDGLRFESGYDCVVRGNIPINSGTSSSSALCVAWVKFLLCIAQDERMDGPEEIAYLAYLAEVEEFGEPGGMMDHNASAIGGAIYVEFSPEFRITRLPARFGAFVLGDSLQEKDTVKTLTRIKRGTSSAVEKIKGRKSDFSLGSTSLEEIRPLLGELPDDERWLLEGAMATRDITKDAIRLFLSDEMDDERLGDLFNAQQEVLRGKLNISTPRIDMMHEAAMKAGALGGKINGSGEGGCMFAYAPSSAEQVAEAIEKAGGKPYVIKIDEGVRRE